MALGSRLKVSAIADLTSALDLATGSVPLSLVREIALANGTGSGQADKIFHDKRTLTASSSENLDLAGVLTDAYGQTITFARVKALIISAAPANVNNVVVGGHATAAWATWVADPTDKVIVRPGGVLALAASDATAYAVTATTADMLTVANSGAGSSVTYDIVIIGASA
jgi:hypothetical protein